MNEDQAAVLRRPDGLFLGIVADGMGGHNAGDLASRMVAEELGRLFMEEEEGTFFSADAKKEWLLQSVKQINRLVYDRALSDPACSGMGTTLIAAIISKDECVLCHIGDSRAYLFDGTAHQITRDHTYVNLLVDTGELSQEEAEDHPKKHLIIRALGTEPDIEGDLLNVELTGSSCLLLCSDGLSNKLSGAEMANVLNGELPLAEKGNELIRLANELGGEDNISFVLFCSSEEVKA